jgi:hypothetical protein
MLSAIDILVFGLWKIVVAMSDSLENKDEPYSVKEASLAKAS